MLDSVLSLAEAALAATSAAGASNAFRDAALARGATYMQTRLYRRPGGPLTCATHWAAGGFVSRHSRPGWVGSGAFDYICFDCNPLLEPVARSLTRYRFGDFAPNRERRFGRYWDALGEAGIGEALCATAYGPQRRIASLHLGFADRDIADADALPFQLAGLMLVEKLMTFADGAAAEPGPALSRRERDCLAFVAEGKTDWEIATILGLSEATARFHVDNARRKLGAVNRAHAVARLFATDGLG